MLGEVHELRSLAGYSPWGVKESDRIERLTLLLFTFVSTGDYVRETECRTIGKQRMTGRPYFREFLQEDMKWLVNIITEEIKKT